MGRNVLIAPIAGGINDADASMRMNLRKEQIEQAPSVESAKQISRPHEQAHDKRFRWMPYWQPDTTLWGIPVPFPDASAMGPDEPLRSEPPERSPLRGSATVTGYGVHAQDGEIGHLEDLVVDDEEWIIRYVEINTRNWLPGKRVLVQTGRVAQLDRHSRSVTMSLTRQAIKSAPAYDPSALITPDYEVRLFKHYGRDAA